MDEEKYNSRRWYIVGWSPRSRGTLHSAELIEISRAPPATLEERECTRDARVPAAARALPARFPYQYPPTLSSPSSSAETSVYGTPCPFLVLSLFPPPSPPPVLALSLPPTGSSFFSFSQSRNPLYHYRESIPSPVNVNSVRRISTYLDIVLGYDDIPINRRRDFVVLHRLLLAWLPLLHGRNCTGHFEFFARLAITRASRS